MTGSQGSGISANNADFTHAILFQGDFNGANFAGADFSFANLNETNFENTILTGATFNATTCPNNVRHYDCCPHVPVTATCGP